MEDINKDELLANFQACTGIDDAGEAMLWLEAADWELLVAVKNALPHDSQTLPSDTNLSKDVMPSNSVNDLSNGLPVTMSPDLINPPTTSRRKSPKMIDFNVWHVDNLYNIPMPEHSTVGALKTVLLAKTGIPTCKQRLTGWDTTPSSDDMKLKTLHLPEENVLALTLESESPMEIDVLEKPETVFTFRILDESSGKEHVVQQSSNQTVRQVKAEVERLSSIPVQEQQWFGWPRGFHDSALLHECQLTLPVHELTLRDARPNKVFIDLVDSDSTPEDYEDASETLTTEDEMFEEDHLPPRMGLPMIPDSIEDEVSGAIHFAERFSFRYGDTRPHFYQGSLEEAIKEACMKPARERRLLALYLHHDRSVLSNVFCTELLCFESVLQTLAANFVIWGWDITSETNRTRLLLSVSEALGAQVTDTISSIKMESLPALIIITRSRSNTELFNVINGNIGISELLSMLIHAVEVYSEILKAEVLEEEERTKREMIKTEQDKAYEQSLLQDMAKEEAKKKQEQLEFEEKERVARELKAKEEKLLAERQEIMAKLPIEPEEGGGDSTVKIKFRCPKGSTMERRFLVTESLQVVFNYLLVQGYKTDEYKVFLSWPKRDLTMMDPCSKLIELQLHPQETMILEER